MPVSPVLRSILQPFRFRVRLRPPPSLKELCRFLTAGNERSKLGLAFNLNAGDGLEFSGGRCDDLHSQFLHKKPDRRISAIGATSVEGSRFRSSP
jgi:hypothetical protein